ncbi:MAG TPA: response regulator [Chryseosolibacter sp.]
MKKTVMIADDDPDILFTIGVMLETAGYEVISTLDGTYVLEGEYESPDLYLLDKGIPDLDGIEICRQLRKRLVSANIPIIVISASPRSRQEALNAGANAFLEKPFQMKDLLAAVKKFAGPV